MENKLDKIEAKLEKIEDKLDDTRIELKELGWRLNSIEKLLYVEIVAVLLWLTKIFFVN